MGRWLRVHVPGADWLAREWEDYLAGCEGRRWRLELDASAARFEDWCEEQSRAGEDLTEALRTAPSAVKMDFLRACRLGIGSPIFRADGGVYLTAFGEIDMHRAFG